MMWIAYVYAAGYVLTVLYGIRLGVLNADDGLPLWLRWVALLIPPFTWPIFWLLEIRARWVQP